jgi:aflatoxin B1 aldehyde reductase
LASYWNESYFKALALVETVAQKHNLTLAEIALRWMSHHSLLKKEHGDAVIIGASSTKHIEQNLIDLEKGPLRKCIAWFVTCMCQLIPGFVFFS